MLTSYETCTRMNWVNKCHNMPFAYPPKPLGALGPLQHALLYKSLKEKRNKNTHTHTHTHTHNIYIYTCHACNDGMIPHKIKIWV